MQKRGGRRAQKDVRAQQAAEDSDDQQRGKQAARLGLEFAAIGYRAGHGARPKSDGASGIGGNRSDSDEEKRWKGDKTAASSDGIEEPGNKSGQEEEESVGEGHVRDYIEEAWQGRGVR